MKILQHIPEKGQFVVVYFHPERTDELWAATYRRDNERLWIYEEESDCWVDAVNDFEYTIESGKGRLILCAS